MTILENNEFVKEIERQLDRKAPVRLGINKKNELVRLIYEICRRDGRSSGEVLGSVGKDLMLEENRGCFFEKIKTRLLWMRYPSLESGFDVHLLPIKIQRYQRECCPGSSCSEPENIFVEEDVKEHEWTKKFLSFFPGSKVTTVKSFSEGVKSLSRMDHVEKYNGRRKNFFLIRGKDAFVKICPCTKGYKRCGYWILNLGFGCPIDCSYCFLQSYSNSPGLILPANIDDYLECLEKLDCEVKEKVRIGTGEFTDSLALDKYTGYSSVLIPFFEKMKNLVLELKTKVSDIEGVLREDPHDNVVISWSVNDESIAEIYEKGGSAMESRIDAAERAAIRGYKVGFHFDPIVYFRGWEKRYKAAVEGIFSRDALRRNTSWVSLGTLRYTPGLKQVAEQRFADNMIYYNGEFFEDTDGKLRYTRELRADMYRKMAKWLRAGCKSSWIYLCMEPEEVWKKASLTEMDYASYLAS